MYGGGHDSNCPVEESLEREDAIYHARYTDEYTVYEGPITVFHDGSATVEITYPHQ